MHFITYLRKAWTCFESQLLSMRCTWQWRHFQGHRFRRQHQRQHFASKYSYNGAIPIDGSLLKTTRLLAEISSRILLENRACMLTGVSTW